MENEKELEHEVQADEPVAEPKIVSTGNHPAPEVKRDDSVLNNELQEKLLNIIDNQNRIIDGLKKSQEEGSRKIELLNEQLGKLDTKVHDNIPTVIGNFDYERTIEQLSKDEALKMEEEYREIYDKIKGMFKR